LQDLIIATSTARNSRLKTPRRNTDFAPNEPDWKIWPYHPNPLPFWQIRWKSCKNQSGSFRRNTCFQNPCSL